MNLSSFTSLNASSNFFRSEFLSDKRTKELRQVLYTPTRRGCVAKIIFVIHGERQTAFLKSIYVEKEWRGRGLAHVLFLLCAMTICEEQMVRELHLEVEEDALRFGKLVQLYECWGFKQVENAKVDYIYNGMECYRKVPMSLALTEAWHSSYSLLSLREIRQKWFCMLILKSSDGLHLVATENGQVEMCQARSQECFWQTILDSDGKLFLRSVYGKFLCVEKSGRILADRSLNSTWETFEIVSSKDHEAVTNQVTTQMETDTCTEVRNQVALKNYHGGYLCVDGNNRNITCSLVPTMWSKNNSLELICEPFEADPNVQSIYSKHQTHKSVQAQIEAYNSRKGTQMSVSDAANTLLKLQQAQTPYQSWVFRYMVSLANMSREDGHPDWIQLVLFMRGFGLLFLNWTDKATESLKSISAKEWLLNASIGRMHVDTFAYPDSDTPEAQDQPSPVLNDEYLYQVLLKSGTTLPDEALEIVRYWSYQELDVAKCSSVRSKVHDHRELLSALPAYTSCIEERISNLQPSDFETSLSYYRDLSNKYLPLLHW
uniref:Inositol oxygenase n=1 Tax=Albugo laibachii Nc14 TaxID=890382 RepID=F0WSW9_9STRA|nr:inositol oxygenase putative [Albugo laibachii Nc14]|eukprot:CCA24453.1 inositol oxygenase putative [Albugo laibachii Nc14]